jgi:glucokinase
MTNLLPMQAMERSQDLSPVAVGDTSSPWDGEGGTATAPQPPPESEIQRLSQETIRRISAEQAISDLVSIVKELVDNALDAEATTIKSESSKKTLMLLD